MGAPPLVFWYISPSLFNMLVVFFLSFLFFPKLICLNVVDVMIGCELNLSKLNEFLCFKSFQLVIRIPDSSVAYCR